MPLFYPDYIFDRVSDIPHGFFSGLGVRGIILDIDNTLTTHDNPIPSPGVLEWLEALRAEGYRMTVLSNNTPERVAPFAGALGLSFVADAGKPDPRGVIRACRSINTPPHKAAIVGDQIFTDMFGGNLAGLATVFVRPIEPERGWFFRLKRLGERIILG